MSTPPRTELLAAALARRERVRDHDTDTLRLVDGDGDRLPDFILEDFGGNWLVSTKSSQALPRDVLGWLEESGRPVYRKRLDQHEKESPEHLCGPELPDRFPIRESGVCYEASFASGYSQGLFLDQRDNRRRVRERSQPGDTVLNTFAYTGAFSVCAALGGATTTTLDLSQPYLDWCRANMQLNGIDPGEQYFIKGDTFHWLKRFAKQGRRFTGIILDPPSFSRDDKGKVFRAEKDYGHLVEQAVACLQSDGWLLCTTNHRGISPGEFSRIVAEATTGAASLSAVAMPEDFTDEPYLKTLWVHY